MISKSRFLLLAVVMSLPFWILGHPLWEVDDARYAEIPREMVETGDWATPKLNYLDYVEKPPLIYWLSAASYSLFGVSEAAARLPLALLALLGLFGAWWLGSWLFSPEAGFWSAVTLGTCLQFSGLCHLITPDMAVSVFLLWASGMILCCIHRPTDSRWAAPAGWLAMALALLSKGLIGLLLPFLWMASLFLLFPTARKGLRAFLLGWGPALFFLVAAPWFVLMESRHPGFFRFFFIEQHFLRYLTPQYNRPGPWYYFFAVELGGTLPWTPLVLAGALSPLFGWKRADIKTKQMCLWVWLVFAFFTKSSSKLITYILPLFAHQSILAGALLSRVQGSRKTSLSFWSNVLGAVLAGASFALPALRERLALPGVDGTLLWTACAVLAALACASLLACRRPLGAAWWAAAANALLLFGAARIDGLLSAKALALDLRARLERSGGAPRIMTYEGYLHGISFYTGRPVDVAVNWVGELQYAKDRDPRLAGRFGDDETIRRLSPEAGTFLAIRGSELGHLLSLKPRGFFKNIRAYGPWALAEL